MNVIPTKLPEVLIIEPRAFGDTRGFFFESYQAERYAQHGIGPKFVQDNISRSTRGVLRGLHFQNPRPQGKLVQVIRGAVFDVAVDIRRSSPRFGWWVGVELDDVNHRQLWVPPEFAHGFLVLSETCDLSYKCTESYEPAAEHSVRWNDPAIGIAWPLDAPTLSDKDVRARPLAEVQALFE